MKTKIILVLLLFSCLACMENEKAEKPDALSEAAVVSEEAESTGDSIFDKERWQIKAGPDYPYRERMLHDLMNNQGLRTLQNGEIFELLGEPDRINEGHLYYRIDQTRLGGLWPLHTKTMVIQLAPDSTVNWIKIHE